MMINNNFFYVISPLEQFVITPLNISVGGWYLTATNQLFALFFLVIFLVAFLLGFLFPKTFSLKVIRTEAEHVFGFVYAFVEAILVDNIKHEKKYQFMPYVLATFLLVFAANACGLIPYTLAVTGQLAFTLTLALNTFLVCLIVSIKEHKIRFFQRFFPGNLNIFLAPLLVPIEVISFFFQPISLAVRLFANIMAGHILMIVFGGFIVALGKLVGMLGVVAWIIPVLVLIPLCILEMAVACIQAYVFTLLTCIYINDSLNLH